MEDIGQQQVPSFQPAQQEPSNISTSNIHSKSKLKFVIAIIIIAILLIGIGGYFMWPRISRVVSQNSLSKSPQDCGTDFDCFLKASESCSPAIVKKSWTMFYGPEFTATDHLEIKGQESAKCVLHYKTEYLSAKFSESQIEKLLSEGRTQEEIKLGEEDALERLRQNGSVAYTCRFDGKDIALILQDSIGQPSTGAEYLLTKRASDCTWENPSQVTDAPISLISLSPSSLKTYQDKDEGWSIQYDSTKFIPSKNSYNTLFTNVDSDEDINNRFCADQFSVNLTNPIPNRTFEEWAEEDDYGKTKTPIIIDGISSVKEKFYVSSDYFYHYNIPWDNQRFLLIYELSYQENSKLSQEECFKNEKENEKAMDKMIQTFKTP